MAVRDLFRALNDDSLPPITIIQHIFLSKYVYQNVTWYVVHMFVYKDAFASYEYDEDIDWENI